jgi:hypothetical protein
MATNFPNNIDSLTNPNASDPLSNPSHANQHINANDAIEALETKVGVDGSTDPNSLDYKISHLAASGSARVSEVLGLEGNNDLTVYGIENPTTIDSLDLNTWRSATYDIQITKGSEVYSSVIKVLFGSNVNVSESNIVSTSDSFHNPANLDFTINGSIISLVVTPIAGSVAVRFIRTAIKK